MLVGKVCFSWRQRMVEISAKVGKTPVFVPENNSIICRGAANLAYKRIEPYLSDYMGKADSPRAVWKPPLI